LADAIEAWVKELNIPKLGLYGVKTSDVDQIVSATSLKNNPVFLTKEELAQLLVDRI
jgi:alcohol dehydrogenase class IV